MGKMKSPLNLDDATSVFRYLVDDMGNEPAQSRLYADVFVEYREAQKNVKESGAITADPRTGAPIENPYLKVRDRAAARIEKMNINLDTEGLW